MSVQQITHSIVTARKPHRCMTCGAVAVQPGEEYVRDVYKYDGVVYVWIGCAPCLSITSDVVDWCNYIDEGVGQEDFEEWARDHADDETHGEAARAYLARRNGVAS